MPNQRAWGWFRPVNRIERLQEPALLGATEWVRRQGFGVHTRRRVVAAMILPPHRHGRITKQETGRALILGADSHAVTAAGSDGVLVHCGSSMRQK